MSPKAIVVLSSLLAASAASADIGFSAAIDASRAATPGNAMFSIQQRVRNGVMIYEGEHYNAGLTSRFQPRINLETGELIRVNVGGVSDAARAALQPIADRLGEVQVDFAAAISTANGASERSDVQKVSYDIEAGILAYQVEYFDGVTKMYVDSVTGGIIPHHGPDDNTDPTNPSTSVIAAIGIAEAHKGAGWVSIGMENEAEKGGNIVEVLMLDLKGGMLSSVKVAGDAVLSVTDFEPIGNQASKVAEIQANWSLVSLGLSGAIGAAESAYPNAGIAETELEINTEDAGNSAQWKINLITAEGIEIDYVVDASTSGFRFAMAPVTFRTGDFNRDGSVNALDLSEIFSAWGAVNPLLDINGDDIVGSPEITAVVSNWG